MRVRGSTVIIAVMFASWVAFVAATVWIRLIVGDWLPSEIIVASAGLFITELACLAKIRMAKEGAKAPPQSNSEMDQMGAGESRFASVLDEVNGKHARSEEL